MGIKAEAVVTWLLFEEAAVNRRVVPFHVDYKEAVVLNIRSASGMVGPGFEEFIDVQKLSLPKLIRARAAQQEDTLVAVGDRAAAAMLKCVVIHLNH